MTGTLLSVLMLLCGYVLADPKRFDGYVLSNYLIVSRSQRSYLSGKPFLLKSNIYDRQILSLMYKGIPISDVQKYDMYKTY